jgi:hypothetical protein
VTPLADIDRVDIEFSVLTGFVHLGVQRHGPVSLVAWAASVVRPAVTGLSSGQASLPRRSPVT